MATKPKFCTECGRALKEVKEPRGFNLYSGKPEFHIFLVCPQHAQHPRYSEYFDMFVEGWGSSFWKDV